MKYFCDFCSWSILALKCCCDFFCWSIHLPLKRFCDFWCWSILVLKCFSPFLRLVNIGFQMFLLFLLLVNIGFEFFCDFYCWSILVVLILASQIFVWQSHSRVNKVLIKIQSPKIPSAGPHSAKLFPIWKSFLNLANPTQMLKILHKCSKSFANAQNPTQMLKILCKCSKSYTNAQQQ